MSFEEVGEENVSRTFEYNVAGKHVLWAVIHCALSSLISSVCWGHLALRFDMPGKDISFLDCFAIYFILRATTIALFGWKVTDGRRQ
jgi:hypothetical protein